MKRKPNIETKTQLVVAPDGIVIEGQFTTRYYHVEMINYDSGEVLERDGLHPETMYREMIQYWVR